MEGNRYLEMCDFAVLSLNVPAEGIESCTGPYLQHPVLPLGAAPGCRLVYCMPRAVHGLCTAALQICELHLMNVVLDTSKDRKGLPNTFLWLFKMADYVSSSVWRGERSQPPPKHMETYLILIVMQASNRAKKAVCRAALVEVGFLSSLESFVPRLHILVSQVLRDPQQ